MCGKVFIKRIIPFFLTFSVGLFIASFFVSIAAPNFKFGDGFRRHQQYHRMMEFENQRLRDKNAQLEKQLADKASQNSDDRDDADFDVPPPPPIPPAPSVMFRTIPYRK